MKVLTQVSIPRTDFVWEAHFYRGSVREHAVHGPVIETGSSLSRVYSHTKNRNIGCITAWRGGNKALPEQMKKNRELQKKLLAEIRNAGFGFVKIKGRYIENKGKDDETEVDEEVALVIGDATDEGKKKMKTLITKWGEKYGQDIHGDANEVGQDSVLFKGYDDNEASLIYTRGEKKGKVEKIGTWHPDKIGDYFSVMKNGQTFTFSPALNKLEPRKNRGSENIVHKVPDWWKALSKENRKKYLKEHPDSGLKEHLNRDLPKG